MEAERVFGRASRSRDIVSRKYLRHVFTRAGLLSRFARERNRNLFNSAQRNVEFLFVTFFFLTWNIYNFIIIIVIIS